MKKVIVRLLIGSGAGILIGYLVNILINVMLGHGEFQPVMPNLAQRCENQMQAVLLQTLLTALIGVVFAEAGAVFEVDRWSFLKQMIVHFCITAPFYLSFSALCWFSPQWSSILGLVVSALVTYLITFYVNYRLSCRDVQQINERVRNCREGYPDA